MSINSQLIKYLSAHGEATLADLSESLSVSRQLLHRLVKKMIEDNYLVKIGTPKRCIIH
ncbi:MAG: MarR family transcriptional regulator [Chitinophagaceae bacterium]